MVVAVFFPSLMGVGIIASGAVLLSDLVVRLLPNRGRRRSQRVAVGAYGVVASVAEAAGRSVRRSQLLDRVPRRRSLYLVAAVVAILIVVVTAIACTAAYRDELGLFHSSPWMIGIGAGVGAVMGALALLAVTLAALGPRLPGPLERLVARTSLGRLQIPRGAVPTVEQSQRGETS